MRREVNAAFTHKTAVEAAVGEPFNSPLVVEEIEGVKVTWAVTGQYACLVAIEGKDTVSTIYAIIRPENLKAASPTKITDDEKQFLLTHRAVARLNKSLGIE